MAWKNTGIPLHMGVLPPFLYGKGLHNHWFVNEVYHSNYRFLFDASWTISNIHLPDSDYHEPTQSASVCANRSDTKDWEYHGNLQLAELYGLFSSQQVDFSDFIKLVKCGRQFMFADKDQNIVYSPEHHSSSRLLKGRFILSGRTKKLINCLADFGTSAWTINSSHKSKMNASMLLHLPYDLEMLLSLRADENKTVVLAVAGYSYKDMLMNWVCRLRHLMINNFLVCALDDEIYEFSIQQVYNCSFCCSPSDPVPLISFFTRVLFQIPYIVMRFNCQEIFLRIISAGHPSFQGLISSKKYQF